MALDLHLAEAHDDQRRGLTMTNVLVFVSGAILMSLEIVGSRVLAPFFGNSIYVWGSLIGVFLGALSLGYYLGGLAADRRPRLSFLASWLAVAGLITFAVPNLSGSVGAALMRLDLGPRLDSLLASMALFFLPGMLMGMVSPFAIKLKARGYEGLGRTAGNLYALSTAGSITGTLATAFFLIPAFGVSDLVRGLGLGLILLAGAGLIADKRWVSVSLVAVVALTLWASWRSESATNLMEEYGGVKYSVVYEKDSLYHNIRVMDGSGRRYLRFDSSWQSGMSLEDPYATVFEYTDFFHLGLVFKPDAKKVLFVGLGGGSAPKKFFKDYPEMTIDVAEIDPDVIRVGREYFSVPNDQRLRLVAKDGRLYLKEKDEKYDLIILDAYYADAIPFHLTTVEFLTLVRDRLNPDGAVIANLIGAFEGKQSRLFRSMDLTFGQVFPARYRFPVLWGPGGDHARLRNIILVATSDYNGLEPEEIVQNAEELAREKVKIPRLVDYAGDLYTGPINYDDVQVLTDDHAPVDRLLIPVMD